MSLTDLKDLPPSQEFSVSGVSLRSGKGRISVTFDVWCGLCPTWEFGSMESRTRAAQRARASGWKLTKEHGWVCPACQAR